ncbi:sugar phosphate isomerase/epimerase family protein [Hymenobacter jejuensis]|uniref:Sugar phosphate isomerase/epimerase n=1 Tax=Hymenobacter jejuensis TaxID=2502781 RepID=A0A5B8A386_9BACT|nr:sugar phosphate isomerase/epimerase family protein [Hymenobacter jejuensis]QDA61579.1 sugar phosphate isomerase/epimerase [Hymenobacter jejuensis]
MTTIQGPAIFLAQFISDQAPFNSLESICAWAKDLGFKGIQIPTTDPRFIDLQKAAESKTYADEIRGTVNAAGLEITELSTHLQGQLVAVHPTYDQLFDGFAPEAYRNNPQARQEWAVQQLKYAAQASQNLGLKAHVTFSGALLWPMVYPWPQRPAGLVDTAFTELARRWTPILNVFDEHGVDLCYEIHAGEDLHDGVTYEMFLDKVNQHPRACLLYDPSHFILQCLDYLEYIDIYHERIKMFHVKDAEFNPTGRQGVYGGYQNWVDRAGRFRSLGDGQVDFKAIFSKLAQYDFPGWAVLEWECALKHPEDGAREGAQFIRDHIIRVTDKAFDDFVSTASNSDFNNTLLGL